MSALDLQFVGDRPTCFCEPIASPAHTPLQSDRACQVQFSNQARLAPFRRKKWRLIGEFLGAAIRPVKQLQCPNRAACTGGAGPKLITRCWESWLTIQKGLVTLQLASDQQRLEHSAISIHSPDLILSEECCRNVENKEGSGAFTGVWHDGASLSDLESEEYKKLGISLGPLVM
jgi:hypothetical protein